MPPQFQDSYHQVVYFVVGAIVGGLVSWYLCARFAIHPDLWFFAIGGGAIGLGILSATKGDDFWDGLRDWLGSIRWW